MMQEGLATMRSLHFQAIRRIWTGKNRSMLGSRIPLLLTRLVVWDGGAGRWEVNSR